MSKRIIASFTLFAFTTLAAPVYALPSANATPSSVVVEKAWGQVSARDGALNQGEALAYGQNVQTGSQSGLTLSFPDGSRVRVSPDSEFRMVTENGKSKLYLLTGKALASASGELWIKTYRTSAMARTGEFVLTTAPAGTDLQVLSGDAQMVSPDQVTTFAKLSKLPGKLADNALLAFGHLRTHQTIGDAEFGNVAGASIDGPDRSQRSPEKAVKSPVERNPGVRRAKNNKLRKGLRPDQDIINPGKKPGAVTKTPTKPPTTTPTTTPTNPPAVGGGGSPWPWVIGGLAGLGAIIAISSDNEDDGPQNFDNANVPSPSFP